MRYVFDDCTLDIERYELRRASVRIPLRPKVFQLLLYLITHRDRVVLKDELVAHLWPKQFVGDAALKSCIAQRARRWAMRGAVNGSFRRSTAMAIVLSPISARQRQYHPLGVTGILLSSCPRLQHQTTRCRLALWLQHPLPLPGLWKRGVQTGHSVLLSAGAHRTLATHLDPEVMHVLMQEVFALAQATVQHYEGICDLLHR